VVDRRILVGRLVLPVIAVLAAMLAFQTAQPHPGVSVDSGEYLAVSEGLAEGRGFTMPYVNFDEPWRVLSRGDRVAMIQFPPLYPAALASFQEGFGLSSLDAARLIGSLAFFLTLLLAMLLIHKKTQRPYASVLAGALLVAPDLLITHAMAWSEPLMLLGLVAGVHGVTNYLESRKHRYLILAGCAGAFAALTRLAGVALIAGFAIVLLIGKTGSPGRRLRVAGVFTSLSLVPLIVWLVRNSLVYGAPSEKSIGLHPPGLSSLVQATRTIGNWMVPGGTLSLIAGIALLAVLLTIGRSPMLQALHGRRGSFALTCGVVGLTYVVFVLFSRTFLDQNVPLDARILAPIQVLALLWVCTAVDVYQGSAKRALALGALLLLGLLTVGRGLWTATEFSSFEVTSYTNDRWRSSETLEFVADVPADTMIISNAVDAMWLWHDRSTQLIPARENLYSGNPNENYPDQVRELVSATRCRTAIVVFFNKPTRKPRRVIEERLVIELGLEPIQRFDDGIVYSVDEPSQNCS
jgi:hypothetical protein